MPSDDLLKIQMLVMERSGRTVFVDGAMTIWMGKPGQKEFGITCSSEVGSIGLSIPDTALAELVVYAVRHLRKQGAKVDELWRIANEDA